MSRYRTMLDRNVTASCTITGSIKYTFETTFVGGIEFYTMTGFCRPDPLSLSFNNGTIELDFASVGENLATIPMPPGRQHLVTATVTIRGMFSFAPTVWTEEIWLDIDDPAEIDISGSATFTLPCSGMVTIEGGGSDDGYASYGGAAVADMPLYSSLTFWERARPGQTAEVALAIDIGSYSVSETIPTGDRVATYSLGHGCVLTSGGTVGTTPTCSVSVVSSVNGEALSCPYTKTYSGAGYSASISAGSGLSVSLTGRMHTLRGGAYIAPVRRASVLGALYAGTGGYPDQVRLRIDEALDNMAAPYDASSTFTKAIEQKSFSASSSLDSTYDAGISANEYVALRMWVDRQWLADHREDTDNWRILLRGTTFDALTLQHLSSYDIDDCAALTVATGDYQGSWSSVSNCTVTDAGGSVSVAVAGGTGVCRRAFSPNLAGMGGYRYLTVKIRVGAAAAQKAYSVRIGTKEWTADYLGNTLIAQPAADGSGATWTIDLCNPTNATATTDTLDTRWPMPTADNGAWGWGVQGTAAIEFFGLSNGAEYFIEHLGLSRLGTPRASWQPAFKWRGEESDGSARRRFLLGNVDGRSAIEESDTLIAADDQHYERTIAELVADINATDSASPPSGLRNPGWKCLIGTSINVAEGAEDSDWEYGWINRQRPATWVYGGGLLYTTAGGWSVGMDVSYSSVTTVKGQILCDRIEWYPGIGDVFGIGPAVLPDPCPLYVAAGKQFRGRAWGIVLDSATTPDLPYDGARVSLIETVGQGAAGEGTADTRGVYQTTGPFGRGGIQHRAQLLTGTSHPYADVTLYARKSQRVCLRGEQAQAAHGSVESDSPRGYLYVGGETGIGVYHVQDWTLAVEGGTYTGDVITRMRTDTRRGLLAVLVREDGAPNTFRVYTSGDGGITATLRRTQAARTAQIQWDSERGVLLFFYENEANIWRQASDDAGATWATATDVATIDPGQLMDITSDTRWAHLYMAVIHDTSDGAIYRSHDLGETWEVCPL